MNARERELLGRLHTAVSRLATLGPRNPADIAGLARADREVEWGARRLAGALSNIGFGDLDEADQDLRDVEERWNLAVSSSDQDQPS